MKMPAGVTMPPQSSVTKSPAFGIIIMLLFFVLILILSGLVFWYRDVLLGTDTVVLPNALPEIVDQQTGTDSTSRTEPTAPLGISNAIEVIEIDIMNSDLSSIAPDITTIENEFINASAQPAP